MTDEQKKEIRQIFREELQAMFGFSTTPGFPVVGAVHVSYGARCANCNCACRNIAYADNGQPNAYPSVWPASQPVKLSGQQTTDKTL